MVNVVSRSPFEYYPTVAPTGGGIATAFQAGATTAEQLETQRAARERQQALLPLEMQQYRTLDEMRRFELESKRAAEARTGAAFEGAGAAQPQLGAPRPTAPGAGFVPSATAQATRTQLSPVWTQLEQAYNLPTGYLDRTAGIESAYNPAAQRPGSQYVGLFQIGPEAAADINFPLDARTNPTRASEGAAQLAVRNMAVLQQRLGRRPEGWELYLAHQQGAGGASALLSNPQAPAIDALTQAYRGNRTRAEQAIIQNGGRLDMTAGQFASIWQNKYGGGGAPAAPIPTAAAPQAGAAAPIALPAGALSPTMMSTGGVPMTAPEGDLPGPGVNEMQAAGAPTGMPLDAQGRPATAGAADNRALGVLQALGTGADWLLGARFRGITGESPTPATPTPSVGLSQPIPGMLPGATPIAPAGFQPTAAGALAPGMLSPTPMAGQVAPIGVPAGVTVARPNVLTGEAPGARVAPGAPAAPVAPAAPSASGQGFIPALLEPATVAMSRAQLDAQQQALMTQRRIAIATRDRQALAAADAGLAQLTTENIRVGGMEALSQFRSGNPAALGDYFYAVTNGLMRLQQNPNGTYNVLRGDTVAARELSPTTIENYFRASFDQRTIEQAQRQREQALKRDEAVFDTELKVYEEARKQEFIGTRDQALKKLETAMKLRLGEGTKVTVADGRIFIVDPAGTRVSVGRFTNLGLDGKTKLPGGQERLIVEETPYGAGAVVPTR